MDAAQPEQPRTGRRRGDQPVLPDDGSERALCGRRAVGHRRHHRLPGADYGRVHHGLRGHRPQLDAASAGLLPCPYPRPAVHSGRQRGAVRGHAGRAAAVPRFGTYLGGLRLGTDHHDDHHHDPAGHLPVAPQQQVRHRCVHHRVPGDPGPVLRRLDGQVPARRLVHAAAHAGDPHDHVHVERGHQAGALAASAHDAEGLPPRAGQAARR